ncbi:hypothetical protein BDW22DRAFT_1363821 [Trametopsis cervina]|nr:hypothetical protein BDW22DRAFT_1363821 [Trametopsis cervina]
MYRQFLYEVIPTLDLTQSVSSTSILPSPSVSPTTWSSCRACHVRITSGATALSSTSFSAQTPPSLLSLTPASGEK